MKLRTELADARRGPRRVVTEGGSVSLGHEAGSQICGVIDEIVRRVSLTGGTTVSVESPGLPDAGQSLAAILRVSHWHIPPMTLQCHHEGGHDRLG